MWRHFVSFKAPEKWLWHCLHVTFIWNGWCPGKKQGKEMTWSLLPVTPDSEPAQKQPYPPGKSECLWSAQKADARKGGEFGGTISLAALPSGLDPEQAWVQVGLELVQLQLRAKNRTSKVTDWVFIGIKSVLLWAGHPYSLSSRFFYKMEMKNQN